MQRIPVTGPINHGLKLAPKTWQQKIALIFSVHIHQITVAPFLLAAYLRNTFQKSMKKIHHIFHNTKEFLVTKKMDQYIK